jgi:hypothetical protein
MRVTLYIPNKSDATFTSLKIEIKELWYKRYGESLSLGSMIIKALIYLKESLQNTNKTDDNKRQTIHQYSRTGSES